VRLPPRPVFLAGREELLADLDVRLAPDAGRRGQDQRALLDLWPLRHEANARWSLLAVAL
jgi:hypothetical protein